MTTQPRRIEFFVPGCPQQRGSKIPSLIPRRGGGFIEKNGRPITVARDDNPKSTDWMNFVRLVAAEHNDGELIQGPVEVLATFHFQRPGYHFGTGKKASVVKLSAPTWHDKSPDLDKLQRSIGDALTGTVIADDKQICRWTAEKRWTTRGEGAVVVVRELLTDVPADVGGGQSLLNLQRD